jgi:hypothetical protein
MPRPLRVQLLASGFPCSDFPFSPCFASLYHLVLGAGFADANLEIHQPAITRGENRFFLKWSVEEAGPALLNAGITTPDELTRTLSEMQHAAEDNSVLILAPRMSQVWALKSAG